MHRRKDYWGPDGELWQRARRSPRIAADVLPALCFDPDRFLDERLNKYFTANPFIFLPFNAGPRICLGQQVGPRSLHSVLCSVAYVLTHPAQFAYNEMSFFLIRLLQNFSHMEMDLAAQPPEARAPSEWASAEGQQGREQIIPKAHLTLYVEVRSPVWTSSTLR